MQSEAVVDLALPWGRVGTYLKKVFTEEECADLVALSELVGYTKALITGGDGKEFLDQDTRKSDRCMVDDKARSEFIWQRIKYYLPPEPGKGYATGLNERLRFLRYGPGDYFKAHYDFPYYTPDGNHGTVYTVLVYLNQGYLGGETVFLLDNGKPYYTFKGETGDVLIFEHEVLHSGHMVLEGVKYILRTDVLYPLADDNSDTDDKNSIN